LLSFFSVVFVNLLRVVVFIGLGFKKKENKNSLFSFQLKQNLSALGQPMELAH
jgi:hypothetical protein